MDTQDLPEVLTPGHRARHDEAGFELIRELLDAGRQVLFGRDGEGAYTVAVSEPGTDLTSYSLDQFYGDTPQTALAASQEAQR